MIREKLREKLSKKKKGLSSFIYGLFFLAILLVLLFVSYRKVVLNDTLNMLNDDLTAASLSGLLPNEEYYSRPSKAGTQTANQLVISETDEAVDRTVDPINTGDKARKLFKGYTINQLLILWSERYNAGSKQGPANIGVYNTPFYKKDNAQDGDVISGFTDFYNSDSLYSNKEIDRKYNTKTGKLDGTRKIKGNEQLNPNDKVFKRAVASVLDSFTSNVLNTDSMKYSLTSSNVLNDSVFDASSESFDKDRKFNIIDNLDALRSSDGIYKIDQSQLPRALKTVITDGITITELNVYNVYKYDYADRHDYKSIFFNETNDTTIHNDGANGTIIFNAPDPKDSTKFEQVEAWNCQTTAVTGDINTWGDTEVASIVNSIISAPNVETVSPGINDTSFFNYYKAHFADSDTDTSKTSALNFEKRWMIDSLYYRLYLRTSDPTFLSSNINQMIYPLHFFTDTLRACQDPNDEKDNLGYQYLYVDDNHALKIGTDIKSKSDVPIRDITSYSLTSSGIVAKNSAEDGQVVNDRPTKEEEYLNYKYTKDWNISIPKSALSPDVTSKTVHSTAILMKIKFNAKVIAKAEFLGNVDARDLTLDLTLPCVVELDQDDKEE